MIPVVPRCSCWLVVINFLFIVKRLNSRTIEVNNDPIEHLTEDVKRGLDGDCIDSGSGVDLVEGREDTMSIYYIDQMVEELEQLRKHRDDLQARNTQLVEENRKLRQEVGNINNLLKAYRDKTYGRLELPERCPNGYR